MSMSRRNELQVVLDELMVPRRNITKKCGRVERKRECEMARACAKDYTFLGKNRLKYYLENQCKE